MKITISQTEFALVLEVALTAVPSRPANPILANFLLIADSDTQQLIITGFDLSLGIRAESKCNVEGSGQIAIRAKLLVDVVSQLPKSDITLEVKDNVVVLTHPTGKCQIQTTSPDEFPNLPEVGGIPVAIPVTNLQQLVKATSFAASHDQTKQIIAGVHFKFTPSNCELAATDGHRLAVASTTGKQDLRRFLLNRLPVELRYNYTLNLVGAKPWSHSPLSIHCTIPKLKTCY